MFIFTTTLSFRCNTYFFLPGVYPPWCFYREQLAPLSACVYLTAQVTFLCGPLARWVLVSLHALYPFCVPLSAVRSWTPRDACWRWKRVLLVLLTLLCLCETYHPCRDYGYHLLLFANLEPQQDQQELLSLSNAISSWKANVCARSTSKYTILHFGCGSVPLALSSFMMSHRFCDQQFYFFFSAVLLFAPQFQNEVHK